jgi:hypothetical protein
MSRSYSSSPPKRLHGVWWDSVSFYYETGVKFGCNRQGTGSGSFAMVYFGFNSVKSSGSAITLLVTYLCSYVVNDIQFTY